MVKTKSVKLIVFKNAKLKLECTEPIEHPAEEIYDVYCALLFETPYEERVFSDITFSFFEDDDKYVTNARMKILSGDKNTGVLWLPNIGD